MSKRKDKNYANSFDSTKDIYEEIYDRIYEDGGDGDSKESGCNEDDDRQIYDIRE